MTSARRSTTPPVWLLLAAVAVVGLFYVKWQPYWDRSFIAAHTHSIGTSILAGKAAHAPSPSWAAAFGYALAYGQSIWKAMVLGLLLGSGVQALLPEGWVVRQLGAGGWRTMVKGSALSVPGMMCTCCAAPIANGLRQARASAGSAIAFWLGNPTLNPATLVFIGFVLGWRWAALRLVLGVVMVFALSSLAERLTAPADRKPGEGSSPTVLPEAQGPFLRRWLTILSRMTLQLLPEYVILVLALGAARAWLFPVIGPEVGDTLPWILGFAVAGALFVIPTAGEVPIIQTMLALGVGAGPAGALLMTLAPISAPSTAMVAWAFPMRLLAAVMVGVIAFGLLGGTLAAWVQL